MLPNMNRIQSISDELSLDTHQSSISAYYEHCGIYCVKITKYSTDSTAIIFHVFQDISIKFGMHHRMGNVYDHAKHEMNPSVIKEVMLTFSPLIDIPLYEALCNALRKKKSKSMVQVARQLSPLLF